MSHISFTARFGRRFPRRISGCERAHIWNLCRVAEGVPDVVRWMGEHLELGGWVAAADCRAFAQAIRAACEQSVRIPGEHGGSHAESALRVGMSAYGRADLNRRHDRQGPVQTWWSLCEWLSLGPGDVVLSYSVSDPVWTWAGFEHVLEMNGSEFAQWLREERAEHQWRPSS